MGLGPSKEKINKILQISCDERINNEQYYIPFRYIPILGASFKRMGTICPRYNSHFSEINLTSVKDPMMFPYCTVGTLMVKFPKSNETFMSTCVMINEKVALTLASNLYNINYGGEAMEIKTTFSREIIQPENVKIMDGFKTNPNDENNFGLIFFSTKICHDHLGVRNSNPLIKYFSTCILSSGLLKSESQMNTVQDKDSMFVTREEGFIPSDLLTFSVEEEELLSLLSKKKKEKENILKYGKGAPIIAYWCSEPFIFSLLNQNCNIQRITKESIQFMIDGINEAKTLIGNKIEDNKIVQLDLSNNDLGPLDIQYLSEFDLLNLQVLDLNSNSIKPQGAFFLSLGKYHNLRVLNLSVNEIGDEGIAHIANSNFPALEQLLLFHNNISSDGVQYLCNADFISNLCILSLSDNPITDKGCKYIKDTKTWKRLAILDLTQTSLTNEGIDFLMHSVMPNLKKILLKHNNSITKTMSDLMIIA